ncbi:Zn(II)2Cys6 transcription factor [Aspergillus homomorphus CBS 101889]|uniref:Zn(2)-C6 fungal-type domain-containing protein n=1 Tax=Aspergillus homomorphus (strain CBS 101889) TaxID=1450537 RepID=A0A395I7P7_ASPHC|nr:hypothetical protein BO97DRAFT_239230 [Aspergillus homomorphus CBS 101889]RAL15088.1 hypothetical protein BO97DRAFT_239230 [Aspergillus homomorphus CBS 101889]
MDLPSSENSHSSIGIPPGRRRAGKSRSRTGCRTCRARRLKCDEAPGACQRCTSTGRVCDGYDVQRLPRPPRRKIATAPRIPALVPTGFRFATTSDENRCFSYFQHRSISHLVASFDDPLWEKLVLQMSYNEPAVYHAIVALGSIHQDLEQHGLPLPGQTPNSTWSRFATEQSLRSSSLLTQRRSSQDPALRQVILVCCLLFTVTELLCARPDTASVHLAGGLRILRELKAQRCVHSEQSTLATYLHLQGQSLFLASEGPILRIDYEMIYEWAYENYISGFTTFSEVQRAFGPVFNASCGFHVRFWKQQQAINYTEQTYEASLVPLRVLSCLNRFLQELEVFLLTAPPQALGEKERRGAQLMKVICHGQIVSVKSCLLRSNGLPLESLMEDYVNLQRMLDETLTQVPCRPLISLRAGLTPVFFLLAQCPDYEIRWWAIDGLQTWPHCGGFFNSRQMAQMVLEGMKIELRALRETHPQGMTGKVSFVRGADGSSFARMLYSRGGGECVRWLRLDG